MSIENMTAREFLAALRESRDAITRLELWPGSDVYLEADGKLVLQVRLDSPTLIADLLGRTDGAT
jgi:hypothetical protein